MVSPSKHKKSDRKGRVIAGAVGEQSGIKKPVKSSKILSNKKIYLDIRNRSVLLKWEKQLKDLGAVIEQFLVREVNVFITDRDISATNNNSTSPAASVSPSPSPSPSPISINSPTDGIGARRTRSRAEAMLESVRQQPGRILYSAEPYEIAKSWKIPIFNVQQFQEILDKKLLPFKKNHGSTQVKVLKGHYIKLEGAGLRPEFCEFKSWPRINLKSSSGSPFDSPTKRKLRGAATTAPGGVTGGGGGVVTTTVYGNDNANRSSRRERMTRKQQTSTDSDQHNGGYCEMCCQDYIDLAEHLASPGHLKLATDPSQFTALDKLIKETFHNNLNGDMCATLLTSPPHHNKRVLRSNKSPPGVAINNYNNETMGNKHTNSDKQIDSRQSTPAPLSPPIQNNLHQSSQNMTQNNMTNGHVTRSTTAGHRQSNCSSSSSSNHNNTITNVEHLHNDLVNKKALPQLPLLNEIQCNGLAVNHNHLTRLSVKTETSQQHHYQLQQSLSPTGSDTSNSHHLRSKKQLWLPTNLLGTTAEDEGNPIRIKNESKAMSPKSKRRKLRRKRLSVEEKLIEDNKSYYKVEVLNSKLRSTGYYMTQREIELNRLKTNDSSTTGNSNLTTDQTHSKMEDKEPVVVRFKKVRKSELSLLSDEAESFMFGEPARKDQDTDDDDDEDDDESSSDAEENSNDTNVNSNSSSSNHKKEIKKEEMIDESSLGSCSSSSQSNMTKRKRRTHAEMFIHDNLDYYKFDIQGSRLRLHGGLLPSDHYKPDPDNIVDDIGDKKVKVEDDCDDKCKINIFSIKNEEDGDSTEEILADQLTFSFESVPDLEPWYQTFKRQDECNEIYHPVYSDYPKIRLPYEYPGFERQKLLYTVRNKFRPFRRRKRRRFLKNVDDKPRKSPRCHASTLAILSSLKYRRKKDSPDKLKLLETPLRSIPQSVNEEQSNTPQLHEEESRSSIIEVSSVPDASSLIKIPEDTKITPELNMRDVSESIDLLFYQLYKDNFDNDKYVHVIKMLSRALENYDEDNVPLGSPSSSHSKGKHRSSKSSPKSSNNVNNNDVKSIFDINEWDMCLDVDPNIVNELETLTTTLTPGPEMDMALLLDNYKSCNSMERADYEHLHPRAIDALRACATDGSCNSSDCGGSSTCELLGFTEDGRMLSKKRKRKKRNMTGWPKDKPKKLVVKNKDECSTKSELASSNSINSDTNNKVIDNNVGNSTTSETTNNCVEVDHKTDLNNYKSIVNNDSMLEQSVCAKNKYSKVKLTRSLSRTGSVDSSTPLSDCNLCVVTGKIGSRQLRGHSNSVDLPSVVIKSSPIKRRASSPEKRPPGRGRRRRTCTATTRWSPWANRKGR